jgi:hypothetical protein
LLQIALPIQHIGVVWEGFIVELLFTVLEAVPLSHGVGVVEPTLIVGTFIAGVSLASCVINVYG